MPGLKARCGLRRSRGAGRVREGRRLRCSPCSRSRALASVTSTGCPRPRLSVAAIARELGLAQNAIYWYFPSKDHLFVAALERILTDVIARRPTRQHGDIERILWFTDQFTELGDLRAAMHERARHSPIVADFVRRLDQQLSQMLASVLSDHVDPDTLPIAVESLRATSGHSPNARYGNLGPRSLPLDELVSRGICPCVARAYQVEIDALGPPARERRRKSLTLFANYIRELLARTSPDGQAPADVPWTAYIGVVYGARQLASDALDDDRHPNLVALGDDLEIWVSDLFRQR